MISHYERVCQGKEKDNEKNIMDGGQKRRICFGHYKILKSNIWIKE